MFDVGQELTLGNDRFRIAEHPEAPGIPYGQEGRAATVYKLQSSEGALAIKIFKQKYRNPALVRLTKQLQPVAHLDGLSVCNRYVLTTLTNQATLSQFPKLLYSVVMPWIEGETWMDVILEKKPLNKEISLRVVRRFLQVMVNLEEQGIAHCDLSGANIMLPILADGGKVELVDVEQLYAPDLSRPESLIAGTTGYVHPKTPGGGWNATADRFAGTILLTEMLGWRDERVRKASWDENYFEQTELQHNTERYRLLKQSLQANWGKKVAALFEQVWRSKSPDDCPTFGEWYLSLNGSTENVQSVISATASIRAASVVKAERKETESTNGHTVGVAEPTKFPLPSSTEVAVPIEHTEKHESSRHPAKQKPIASAPAAKPAKPTVAANIEPTKTYTEQLVKPTPSKDAVPSPILSTDERWQPDIPESSSGSQINIYLVAFLGVGSLTALLILIFNGLLSSIGDALWRNGGYTLYNGIGAGVLSLVISLVQVWIFRNRLPDEKRLFFVLATTGAGALGGFVAGLLLGAQIIPWALSGVVVGIIGGFVASFAQSSLMRNNEAKQKWLLWNTAGWVIAWAVGWYIGLIIDPVGVVGMAVTAAFVTTIVGLSLIWFLKSTPEFEF